MSEPQRYRCYDEDEMMPFDNGEYLLYTDAKAWVEREVAQRHPEVPIQVHHDPLCFPAIRDVRVGDWGPSCFTCQVIGMAREQGQRDGL